VGLQVRLSSDCGTRTNRKSLPLSWEASRGTVLLLLLWLNWSRTGGSKLFQVVLQEADFDATAGDALGFRFALEHFGTGRDPLKLLADIRMNFIKVDGSLMQGLSTNQLQQQRVKGLVEAAKRKGVETVAERVEDANTMAVLWQLGIEFIQGYFVNAPEDVTMSGDR